MKEIGAGAFSSTGANTITFGNNLETIGEGAFTWSNVTSLVLPDTLKTIGDSAFSLNTSLVSLTLGVGLVTLDENAFYNCQKLTGQISLGSNFANYLPGSFANCIKIEDFQVDTNNKSFVSKDGLLLSHDQKEVFAYASSHKNNGTVVSSLTLPDTVTTIKKRGLDGAVYLTSLTLSSSLTTIEEEAFANTNGVKTLNIPTSVSFVGKNAFKYFTSSQTVHFNCTEDFARMNF